jgi:hypothetical protein
VNTPVIRGILRFRAGGMVAKIGFAPLFFAKSPLYPCTTVRGSSGQ